MTLCYVTFITQFQYYPASQRFFKELYLIIFLHNLITKNQSGFIPGDSTINQLCNQLYICIDEGNDMVAVFLDLSEAFDRVWHKGLL